MMNKTIILSAANILGFAVLLGSLSYSNAAYANQAERQACADKYLPDDQVGYRVCTGEQPTPSTGP
jgi:hypothetical protein